ncbi:MAG: hypothetical protein HKM04_03980 [Legionellales bacterium]|nr:hypothetical protein [Legionellales bacterium]
MPKKTALQNNINILNASMYFLRKKGLRYENDKCFYENLHKIHRYLMSNPGTIHSLNDSFENDFIVFKLIDELKLTQPSLALLFKKKEESLAKNQSYTKFYMAVCKIFDDENKLDALKERSKKKEFSFMFVNIIWYETVKKISYAKNVHKVVDDIYLKAEEGKIKTEEASIALIFQRYKKMGILRTSEDEENYKKATNYYLENRKKFLNEEDENNSNQRNSNKQNMKKRKRTLVDDISDEEDSDDRSDKHVGIKKSENLAKKKKVKTEKKKESNNMNRTRLSDQLNSKNGKKQAYNKYNQETDKFNDEINNNNLGIIQNNDAFNISALSGDIQNLHKDIQPPAEIKCKLESKLLIEKINEEEKVEIQVKELSNQQQQNCEQVEGLIPQKKKISGKMLKIHEEIKKLKNLQGLYSSQQDVNKLAEKLEKILNEIALINESVLNLNNNQKMLENNQKTIVDQMTEYYNAGQLMFQQLLNKNPVQDNTAKKSRLDELDEIFEKAGENQKYVEQEKKRKELTKQVYELEQKNALQEKKHQNKIEQLESSQNFLMGQLTDLQARQMQLLALLEQQQQESIQKQAPNLINSGIFRSLNKGNHSPELPPYMVNNSTTALTSPIRSPNLFQDVNNFNNNTEQAQSDNISLNYVNNQPFSNNGNGC